MGVLCTHSTKSPGPFPKLSIKNLKKIKKFQKKGPNRPCPGVDLRPLVAGWPWANDLGSMIPGRQAADDQWSWSGRPAMTKPWPLVADILATRGRRPPVVGSGPAGDQQSPAGRGWTSGQGRPAPSFLNFFLSCPPLFAQVVNSCWLVPAHARPAQSSPKNFKHP
jgi:hypothetical protein